MLSYSIESKSGGVWRRVLSQAYSTHGVSRAAVLIFLISLYSTRSQSALFDAPFWLRLRQSQKKCSTAWQAASALFFRLPRLAQKCAVKKAQIVTALSIYVSLSSALADEKIFRKLPLDEVLKTALEKNPDLLAAKAKAESMEASVIATRSLPRPEVGLEFWGIGGEPSAEERWYSISQTIPFPSKIFTKASAISHQARRSREAVRGMEREITARVKRAYYELFFSTKAVSVYQEQSETLSRLAQSAQAKYSVGKGTQADLLQAQMELARMETLRESAKKERWVAEAALCTLMDQPPGQPLGEPEPPKLIFLPASSEKLEELSLQSRPDVKAARHHISHMEAQWSVQRQEFLPDFGVKYSYRKRPGMKDDSILMITMSVPFLFFWKPVAEVRSASRELLEANLELRSKTNNTRLEVRDHLARCQNHARVVKTYEMSVLLQSKQQLRVSESAYIADKIKFFDYLSSQRSYLGFHLEYYQSVKDYGQTLAELERIVGPEFGNSSEEGKP